MLVNGLAMVGGHWCISVRAWESWCPVNQVNFQYVLHRAHTLYNQSVTGTYITTYH